MSETMKTIEIKKRISEYFGINSATDKEIVDFLCLASNTLTTVENCFEQTVKAQGSLNYFYKSVVSAFLHQDMFPMCLERIITFYPELFDYALKEVMPTGRLYPDIWNNGNTPYVDCSLLKVPFNGQWCNTMNFAGILKSEHTYVVEQLLSKLDQVQYEFTGEVKLVTGNETRTIRAGFYTFYYGKNWLIMEVNTN